MLNSIPINRHLSGIQTLAVTCDSAVGGLCVSFHYHNECLREQPTVRKGSFWLRVSEGLAASVSAACGKEQQLDRGGH